MTYLKRNGEFLVKEGGFQLSLICLTEGGEGEAGSCRVQEEEGLWKDKASGTPAPL